MFATRFLSALNTIQSDSNYDDLESSALSQDLLNPQPIQYPMSSFRQISCWPTKISLGDNPTPSIKTSVFATPPGKEFEELNLYGMRQCDANKTACLFSFEGRRPLEEILDEKADMSPNSFTSKAPLQTVFTFHTRLSAAVMNSFYGSCDETDKFRILYVELPGGKYNILGPKKPYAHPVFRKSFPHTSDTLIDYDLDPTLKYSRPVELGLRKSTTDVFVAGKNVKPEDILGYRECKHFRRFSFFGLELRNDLSISKCNGIFVRKDLPIDKQKEVQVALTGMRKK